MRQNYQRFLHHAAMMIRSYWTILCDKLPLEHLFIVYRIDLMAYSAEYTQLHEDRSGRNY